MSKHLLIKIDHMSENPLCAAADYLTSDGVMASKAQTMQSTIAYMKKKYGSAAGYVKAIGLTPSEVSAIRLNMLVRAAPKDLLERLSLSNIPRGRGSLSPQNSRQNLSRRTYSGDGGINRASLPDKNDRFDANATLSTSPGAKSLHRRSLSRRSKTFNTLSRRSKDGSGGPSLETFSKQPHEIMINKRIEGFADSSNL